MILILIVVYFGGRYFRINIVYTTQHEFTKKADILCTFSSNFKGIKALELDAMKQY